MAEAFHIEGLRELEHALTELPKATGKNALKRALMKAGEPIVSAAEALAPVRDDGGKPVLKASIDVSTKLSRRQKRQHKQESAVEVFIGAGPLPQAHLQEFGSSVHGAQPFLRPAWDGNRMAALNSIKRDLADEIEKARKRLARKAERVAAKIRAGG